MKEFDAPQPNGKNSTMRVVAKKGQTMDVARHEFSQDAASVSFSSLTEKIQHILRGLHVWQATFQHQLDRWTFGAFTRFGGMVFVKVFILGIIMFGILHEPIASIEKTVTFAGGKEASKEKTQQGKQKQRGNNTTAALGSGVSFDLSPAARNHAQVAHPRRRHPRRHWQAPAAAPHGGQKLLTLPAEWGELQRPHATPQH